MATRLYIAPGRIIISRAGYEASPSLADRYKVLDSNWDFSGGIIAKGTVSDPAAPSGEDYLTEDTSPLVITFPSCGYVPAAYVYQDNPNPRLANSGADAFRDFGFSGFHEVEPINSGFSPGNIQDGLISIPRPSSFAGKYVRYAGTIRYIVFAVSQ